MPERPLDRAVRAGDRAAVVIEAARELLAASDAGTPELVADKIELLRSCACPPVTTNYDPRSYIASQTWTYARTRPENPHEYVMLRASTNPIAHLLMNDWIRQTGAVEMFNGRPYLYREVGGWRYWVMGINETILNRRVAPGGQPDVRVTPTEQRLFGEDEAL